MFDCTGVDDMSISQFSVENKKVLCVGAGRGIGRGIALAFAEAGADVAVTGLKPAGANRVAEEVRKLGRQGVAFAGDATRSSDMDRLAGDVLQQFGHLDVLVNCVGDGIAGPVATLPEGGPPGMTETEWHNIIDVNLTEAFQGCRSFGPHFLERRRGCVINISGYGFIRGTANRSAYSAAKAGLTRFTESLAQEWAPYRVRVNAIAPGMFPDPEQMSPEDYHIRQESARETVPLGRLGRLKEAGYLAVFLASAAADYVTGQTWAVDGGLSIKAP